MINLILREHIFKAINPVYNFFKSLNAMNIFLYRLTHLNARPYNLIRNFFKITQQNASKKF